MKRIVILASGSGTNAENIIKYFKNNKLISVVQVLSNKKDAKVLERAKRLNISSINFNKSDFFTSDKILTILKFPNKILNIHPALLPKYGGKGMYGMHVHEAVVTNHETESGITIHYVNENYDEGAIVFQERFNVLTTDTAEDVAQKVHKLEYEFFPKVIEQVV